MKNLLLTVALLFIVSTMTGCWQTADEGTATIQTIYGKITTVIHGGESIWTIGTWGDEYYDINLRSFTEEVDVAGSTKDNAGFVQRVATSSHVINDSDEDLKEYMRKFGLNEKDRHERRDKILKGLVATEYRNVVSQYDAYSLLANQETIQKQVTERLRPLFKEQLKLDLESVQLTTRPDFVDDRIEQAASAVVANQKLKEAAEAALVASRVDAERKQVEAQAYANPNLLEIRKLELQKEIAAEWSKHQGTLVFGSGSQLSVTDKK